MASSSFQVTIHGDFFTHDLRNITELARADLLCISVKYDQNHTTVQQVSLAFLPLENRDTFSFRNAAQVTRAIEWTEFDMNSNIAGVISQKSRDGRETFRKVETADLEKEVNKALPDYNKRAEDNDHALVLVDWGLASAAWVSASCQNIFGSCPGIFSAWFNVQEYARARAGWTRKYHPSLPKTMQALEITEETGTELIAASYTATYHFQVLFGLADLDPAADFNISYGMNNQSTAPVDATKVKGCRYVVHLSINEYPFREIPQSASMLDQALTIVTSSGVDAIGIYVQKLSDTAVDADSMQLHGIYFCFASQAEVDEFIERVPGVVVDGVNMWNEQYHQRMGGTEGAWW